MKLIQNLIYCLLIVFLLNSCDNKPIPLRVGLLVWPPYEFFYLAEKEGFYDEYSIDLIDYKTPSEVMRAYNNGLLDAIIITNHLYIQLNNDFQRDQIIQVINYSKGADVLLVKPEFNSVNDLVGKRIGAEASGLGLYVLQRFLEFNNISIDQINYVPVDVANQVEEFRDGKIDAVITYEPFATKIKSLSGKEIFNSSQIPFEICDVLISKKEIIESKKDQFISLSEGYFKALNLFKVNPNAYEEFLAEREGISPKEFIKALNGIEILDLNENQKLYTDNKDIDFLVRLENVNKKMVEFGIVKNVINSQNILNSNIIMSIEE